MAQFCKSCQTNGVNTRVEWQVVGTKPDGSPKKGMFDIDKQEMHKCPYWKPDPNYKKKVPPEIKEEFEKIERDLKTEELKNQMNRGNVDLQTVLDAVNNVNLTVSEFRSDMLVVKELMEALSNKLGEISFERANRKPLEAGGNGAGA